MIVKVRPAAMPRGAKFPYKGRNEKILEALKPSRFVQSDNEKIIELARKAVGDTKDAAEAVRRIEQFVADFVETKNLSRWLCVGCRGGGEQERGRLQRVCCSYRCLVPSWREVPARVVCGIAYVKEWEQIRDSFGGHAWVEAYVGDRWVGLDSAFRKAGRGGFDAGHNALAEGVVPATRKISSSSLIR